MLLLHKKHQENYQENNCVVIFVNDAICYEIRDAFAKIMRLRGILECSK